MKRCLLILTALFTGAIVGWQYESVPQHPKKINGVSLVASRRPITAEALEPVKGINANWVALIPYAFGEAGRADIVFNSPRQWWGERTEGIAASIKQAHKLGLKVMVKPQVWVRGEGWTGSFSLEGKHRKKWEKRYSNFILTYARVADSLNAEMICIGTEFSSLAHNDPGYWRGLIKQLRKQYDGKLTYAANWDDYRNIAFWDKLDYIGIDAYFPLSEEKTASVKQLKNDWRPVKRRLADFSKQEHKPILFTEFGYRSINYAAAEPWKDRRTRRENINMPAQTHAYRALLKVFWHEPWFAGGFAWKWYVHRFKGKAKEPSRYDEGYTPQGKPAERVLRAWYGRTLMN